MEEFYPQITLLPRGFGADVRRWDTGFQALEEKENRHEKHKIARKEDRYFVAAIHDRGVEGEGFLVAALIADGLSPLDPSKVQLEAGKTLLREIQSNLIKRVDFAFETTLSGRSYVRLLKELRSKGWKPVR